MPCMQTLRSKGSALILANTDGEDSRPDLEINASIRQSPAAGREARIAIFR